MQVLSALEAEDYKELGVASSLHIKRMMVKLGHLIRADMRNARREQALQPGQELIEDDYTSSSEEEYDDDDIDDDDSDAEGSDDDAEESSDEDDVFGDTLGNMMWDSSSEG